MKTIKETRNSKLLRSFMKYAEKHPQERFWQALLNWSGLPYVCWGKMGSKLEVGGDTYYWEGKTN